jgi:hypothetical protein
VTTPSNPAHLTSGLPTILRALAELGADGAGYKQAIATLLESELPAHLSPEDLPVHLSPEFQQKLVPFFFEVARWRQREDQTLRDMLDFLAEHDTGCRN